MFNFLKKLFRLKPEEESVALEKLEQWFNDKAEPIYSKLNEQLKEQINNIPEIIDAIKRDITELEKAGIKDEEKIEPKVKQVVLGNRINYIRLLGQFVGRIEIPSEINAENSIEFSSGLNKKLDELSKNTQKTYYTVQHLFPDEVERIAKDIKNLNDAVKGIKAAIEKSNISAIKEGKADIQKLIKSINRKERLKKELIELKGRLNKSQKLKQESETKIINLRNSKEYGSFNKLKQEKDYINSQISNARNHIKELFSSLMPGLKKYQRVTLKDDKPVGEYAANPVKALLGDADLKIIEILQNMKKSILSNAIDLRDKKRKRTLEKTEQITKEELQNILSEYDRLKHDEKEIDDKLKADKIMPLIEEAEYKLEHHTQMVQKIKKDMAKTEEDAENIKVKEIEKEVQDKIKEAINVEIKLLFSNP
jgi:hypothetical protein